MSGFHHQNSKTEKTQYGGGTMRQPIGKFLFFTASN